jgi:acyl-CoA synthetase (AMP-forming)/AMP-acid ligase II
LAAAHPSFPLREADGVTRMYDLGLWDEHTLAVPDDRLGARACAVVVPVAGAAPDLAGICAFLRERDVAVVTPSEELVLVDALPTNAGGKIDKAGVRDAALAELRSRPGRPTIRPTMEGTA